MAHRSICLKSGRRSIASMVIPVKGLNPPGPHSFRSHQAPSVAMTGKSFRIGRRRPCAWVSNPYLAGMELNLIQDYAIQARVASVIGATVFDRVFAGIRFAETDGPLLYVYAKDEQNAGEIEDDFSLLIADIASQILKREVELVVVLPKVLQ